MPPPCAAPAPPPNNLRIAKLHAPVAAVAERLVLRRAAAAQRVMFLRRAVAELDAHQLDCAGHRIRTVVEDGAALAGVARAPVVGAVAELRVGETHRAVRAIAERLVLRAAAAAQRHAAHIGAGRTRLPHEVRHLDRLRIVDQVTGPIGHGGDARLWHDAIVAPPMRRARTTAPPMGPAPRPTGAAGISFAPGSLDGMLCATDRCLTRMRDAIEAHFRGELELGRLVHRLAALLARAEVEQDWRDEFTMAWLELEQVLLIAADCREPELVPHSERVVLRVLSRLLPMVEIQLIARRGA